jgi:hypothetical protein
LPARGSGDNFRASAAAEAALPFGEQS